jgi:hypothetical protein
MSTAPAGWYTDPSGQEQQRWWDGAAWTEHVQPAAVPVAEPVGVGAAVGAGGPSAAASVLADIAAIPASTAAPQPGTPGSHSGGPGQVAHTPQTGTVTTWPVAGGAGGGVPGGGPAPRSASRTGVEPLAVVSLVAALLWVVGLGALIAIVSGVVVLRRGVSGTSKRLALAGVVLGVLGLLPAVLLVLVVGGVVALSTAIAPAVATAQLEGDVRSAAVAQELHLTATGSYTDDLGALEVTSGPGTELSIVFAGADGYCVESTDGAQVVHLDSRVGTPQPGPC